jgi:hypothetical protein
MLIVFAAAMTPVAMANVRALHLCCPPKSQASAAHDDAMADCGHDHAASSSTPAFQSDMQDCSRHMVSTAAPGAVSPAAQVIVGRPRASHPILDEFDPLFAPAANRSLQKDRAPPLGQ